MNDYFNGKYIKIYIHFILIILYDLRILVLRVGY